MRKIDILDSHSEPDVCSVLSDYFNNDNIYNEDSKYIVDVDKYKMVNTIKIVKKDEYIKLGIDHISVQEAKNKNLLDKVPEFMSDRNEILEEITGKNSDERKNDMRKNVLPDSDLVDFN